MKPSSPAGLPPTSDLVPDLSDIMRFFTGTAMMIAGRSDGLRRLDLSADGFWQSFSAMIVALPPAAISWVEFETMERTGPAPEAGAVAIYGAHALADFLAWVLPVFVLMMVARRIGYGKKIVPLVVATNWGGAFLSWLFAPYWALVLLFGPGETTKIVGALVTLASIALTVRLIFVALGKDFVGALGVAVLMVVATLMSYGAVMDVTGVALV